MRETKPPNKDHLGWQFASLSASCRGQPIYHKYAKAIYLTAWNTMKTYLREAQACRMYAAEHHEQLPLVLYVPIVLVRPFFV